MRFRLFDARGEPQRNSIPLVERSRSGLFTWSGGGAINRRAIAISPGRRARLEFHANRAASRLLVIEILEILAERVCVRVRMCERAREREGGGRVFASLVLHQPIISTFPRIPRRDCYLLFASSPRTKSLESSVDEVISKEKKRSRSSRQPCSFADSFSPTVPGQPCFFLSFSFFSRDRDKRWKFRGQLYPFRGRTRWTMGSWADNDISFFFFLWSKRPLTIFPVEIIGISLKFSFGENIFEIVKNLERDN